MKKNLLQLFTASLISLPCFLSAQADNIETKSEQIPLPTNSNAGLQQKHRISAAEFLRLPVEKQLHIRNNPNLYVLDENIKVELQRPIRHRVLRSEYNKMPETKKAYIDANPDKYVIVD